MMNGWKRILDPEILLLLIGLLLILTGVALQLSAAA
jgi:hypothetical protein